MSYGDVDIDDCRGGCASCDGSGNSVSDLICADEEDEPPDTITECFPQQ